MITNSKIMKYSIYIEMIHIEQNHDTIWFGEIDKIAEFIC